MRSVDLRFSDDTYGLIQQEADALEVSVAQFSRVAVVPRAAFCAHRRGFAWGTAAPEETALRTGVGLGGRRMNHFGTPSTGSSPITSKPKR